MRTSTKILIVTFALLCISLVIYDIGLKAEYRKGNFTDPFRNYVALNYRNFDEVDLESSTAVNIMLVQGPFKVMVQPDAMEFVKVSQHNKKLTVSAAFRYQYRGFNTDYIVYISCPNLAAFKADAWYTTAGNRVTDTVSNDFNWKSTSISGFTADSLSITEDHASNVVMENNKINSLKGIVGISDKSRSNLTIGQNNRFVKTDLNVLNASHLWIKGATGNLNFHLADSASLVVNGAAAKNLLKTN